MLYEVITGNQKLLDLGASKLSKSSKTGRARLTKIFEDIEISKKENSVV